MSQYKINNKIQNTRIVLHKFIFLFLAFISVFSYSQEYNSTSLFITKGIEVSGLENMSIHDMRKNVYTVSKIHFARIVANLKPFYLQNLKSQIELKKAKIAQKLSDLQKRQTQSCSHYQSQQVHFYANFFQKNHNTLVSFNDANPKAKLRKYTLKLIKMLCSLQKKQAKIIYKQGNTTNEVEAYLFSRPPPIV